MRFLPDKEDIEEYFNVTVNEEIFKDSFTKRHYMPRKITLLLWG